MQSRNKKIFLKNKNVDNVARFVYNDGGGDNMIDDMKIYPELLYYRTKVKKMTVEDVIKGTEMSKATYLRIENGKRELTLREAIQIAQNMEIELKVLFPKFF